MRINKLLQITKCFCIPFLMMFFLVRSVAAGDIEGSSSLIKDISAEGSCAVVGMSAEQSQLIALQRARVAAIEQAAGVKITSSTVVTNARMAIDFIKTYSKGLIVNERVDWLPISQYQKDKSTPPVPEYRVKITADVYKPVRKIRPLGLAADINESIFRNGEKGRVKISTAREARIAVFNVTAEDNVIMLFPNQYEKGDIISDHGKFVFPAEDSPVEMVFRTLPGHERDAEAIFVVAMDTDYGAKFIDMFKPLEPMDLTYFFSKYSEFADYCEDKLLPYEVSR